MPQMPIPDTEPEVCEFLVCWPNDEKWLGLLRGLLGAPTQGRYWDATTGSIVGVQAFFKQIWDDNINVDERQVIMACDSEVQFQEFIDKEERIAVALESLASNQAVRYTVQDMIDDIEDAFGVGHLLFEMASAFIGLFPRLKLKVDATPIVTSLVETYFRWIPLNAALADIAFNTTVLAGAAAGTKIQSLLGLVLSALDFQAKNSAGFRDWILGEGGVFRSAIAGIRALFVSSGDGGDGGDDPDNDPDIRISVQNTVFGSQAFALAQSLAEALAFSNAEAITFSVVEPPEVAPPLSPGSQTVPEDVAPYGLTEFGVFTNDMSDEDDIACQVAHNIVDDVVLFLDAVISSLELSSGAVPPVFLINQMSAILESMLRENPNIALLIPRPVSVALAALLSAASIGGPVGAQLQGAKDWLVLQRPDVAGVIYCIRSDNEGEGISTLLGAKRLAAEFEAAEDLNRFHKTVLATIFGTSMLAQIWFERVSYVAPATNTEVCLSCGT